MPELLSGPKVCTGSHRASAAAVRDGDADFASIDAQTWRQLTALGETNALSVVHRTQPVPGLPLITNHPELIEELRTAIRDAILSISAEDLEMIGLRDLVIIPSSAYDLPIPPAPQAFGS